MSVREFFLNVPPACVADARAGRWPILGDDCVVRWGDLSPAFRAAQVVARFILEHIPRRPGPFWRPSAKFVVTHPRPDVTTVRLRLAHFGSLTLLCAEGNMCVDGQECFAAHFEPVLCVVVGDHDVLLRSMTYEFVIPCGDNAAEIGASVGVRPLVLRRA